jgi:hypothetical protein
MLERCWSKWQQRIFDTGASAHCMQYPGGMHCMHTMLLLPCNLQELEAP